MGEWVECGLERKLKELAGSPVIGIPCEGSHVSGSADRLKLLPSYGVALSASWALDREYI